MPRHLRFAQALALVSGLGACASAPPPEPAPTPTTTARRSAGAEHLEPCARCSCDYGSTNPASCYDVGHSECCYDSMVIEGPLPPPDLPA